MNFSVVGVLVSEVDLESLGVGSAVSRSGSLCAAKVPNIIGLVNTSNIEHLNGMLTTLAVGDDELVKDIVTISVCETGPDFTDVGFSLVVCDSEYSVASRTCPVHWSGNGFGTVPVSS